MTSETAGGALSIAAGATVAFDTYFNAVFELHWRLNTRLAGLTLSLQMEGAAILRVWRRVPGLGCTLLVEQPVGNGPIRLPDDVVHVRQAGLIWFELTACDGVVRLLQATWSTEAPAAAVGLGVVICTFNREEALAAVLDAIAGCAGLDEAVTRVIVVNQGRPGLIDGAALEAARARLGGRLRVVEQANLGGAGGFSRGLLESLDDPAVTHTCFLDDDVRLEPESLARMAAFFRLARPDVALGGHMLDSLQPTSLYEAGAVVRRNGTLEPLHHAQDLREPGALDRLLDIRPMHYNGWWMFGFPNALVGRVGMPLPCFIRGDDVEFGVRLHEGGVPTVSLPGVAIWHEPFYVKLGGWQLYYETRNAIVCSLLHPSLAYGATATCLLKRLLIQLLTFRYYNAALIVRAMEDALLGPAILDRDPRPTHASLGLIRTAYPEVWTTRDQVLAAAVPMGPPRWLSGWGIRMGWCLLRNLVWPVEDTVRRLPVRDLVWFRVLRCDALAVDTHWDRDLLLLRRNRGQFRRLLGAGARAAWRLGRHGARLRTEWAAAAPRLTSVAFWRGYVRTGG